MNYPLTSLATLFIMGVYFWTLMNVGKARSKYGVKVPMISGNADFERVFRVQENTKEQLVLFLPIYWLAVLAYPMMGFADCIFGFIGLGFGLGRIIYARGYYIEAPKRQFGFMVGFIIICITYIGALYGVISQLI